MRSIGQIPLKSRIIFTITQCLFTLLYAGIDIYKVEEEVKPKGIFGVRFDFGQTPWPERKYIMILMILACICLFIKKWNGIKVAFAGYALILCVYIYWFINTLRGRAMAEGTGEYVPFDNAETLYCLFIYRSGNVYLADISHLSPVCPVRLSKGVSMIRGSAIKIILKSQEPGRN